LPLERIHVKNCIREELSKHEFSNFLNKKSYEANYLEKDVDQIANQLTYEPDDIQKYSTSGCKRVPFLVSKRLDNYDFV
jgi:hypothetical protein